MVAERIQNYATTCWALLLADLSILKKKLPGKLIDCTIVVVANMLVMGKIMQRFGLADNFGLMMLGGLIPATMLFSAYTSICTLVMDIEGPRTISYYLTLPIPSWLVLMYNAVFMAIESCTLTITIIPIGKLILGADLNLMSISWGSLGVMYIITSLFFGFFALCVTTLIKGVAQMESIWTRFIFPLWIFGGFMFTWFAIYATYPALAYVILGDPLMYATEGFKAAIMPNGQFLPLIVCVSALIGFAALSWVVGFLRLKKKLDFV